MEYTKIWYPHVHKSDSEPTYLFTIGGNRQGMSSLSAAFNLFLYASEDAAFVHFALSIQYLRCCRKSYIMWFCITSSRWFRNHVIRIFWYIRKRFFQISWRAIESFIKFCIRNIHTKLHKIRQKSDCLLLSEIKANKLRKI